MALKSRRAGRQRPKVTEVLLVGSQIREGSGHAETDRLLPVPQPPGTCLVELIVERSEIHHRGFDIAMAEMPLHTNEVFLPVSEQMNGAGMPKYMRMLFFQRNLGPPAILSHQRED